jgi:multiple sugar transport system substrate-binding protein
MRWTTRIGSGLALAALVELLPHGAHASDYNWQRDKGQTIHFLVNNNSLGQALVAKKDQFEKLTGVTVKVDIFQEQQMRQRLLTVLNAKSSELDVFMTLPSREGEQFSAAGWLTDLGKYVTTDAAPNYDFGDISKKLVDAATFSGRLTSLPVNIEGRCCTGERISSRSVMSSRRMKFSISWRQQRKSGNAIRRSRRSFRAV